jgi:guanosine-3',5'-bis(diphosphate) 3'-pyrophosphohydrolase
MQNFDTTEIHNFEGLKDLINSSNVNYDLLQIEKAYNYAQNLHKETQRASGETQMVHVLTVAAYIVRLNLDNVSVIAALLHDTVDKGNVSIDDIDKEFGTEVAFIIDGVNSIRSFTKKFAELDSGIENFKNMIFNITEDVRIILIRLAEKLHNLLTINTLPVESERFSARKALLIYAPLAEYLGLGFFQRTLEDLAFKILNPEEYSQILNLSQKYEIEKHDLIDDFNADLKNLLSEYKIKFFDMQIRKKGIYSIYKKLKAKHLQPDEPINAEVFGKLKDIYASRVILNNVEECYLVLGLVHSKWEFSKEDFDDYIAKPKENGYRSIQTTISYKSAFFEVQIRTQEMHEYNEFGPASHIAYKLKGSKSAGSTLTWTKDLVKWQESPNLSKEDFQIKTFASSIFVFTPKGLVIRLEKQSSPIDFAFRIHTGVGSHYCGALVNGKMVSMEHKLQTGDVVEVLTSKNAKANLDWLKFAKSTSTRAKIRKILQASSNM